MHGYSNPRRNSRDSFGRNLWYPYYAGFSPRFAAEAIAEAGLKRNARVVDPWNGGGTTTWAAHYLGLSSWGGDLNPAMLIVAKARNLGAQNCLSASVLAGRIVRSKAIGRINVSGDPLAKWLSSNVVAQIRTIERSVNRHVVPEQQRLPGGANPEALSELSCFFYLALFTLARRLARSSKTSNPTWSKQRNAPPTPEDIDVRSQFVEVVKELAGNVGSQERDGISVASKTILTVASSASLPLKDDSADFVLTSPPYCTRIDYAVATAIELAVLGIDAERLDLLRRTLMGATTVPKFVGVALPEWGDACCGFLDKVKNHQSYASSGYYYKSHVQYFSDLSKSISEISRVLKAKARAIIVVQDSQYKEIHNDLALVVTQMAIANGMSIESRTDFSKSLTMRSVHPHSRKYARTKAPVESVLNFRMK